MANTRRNLERTALVAFAAVAGIGGCEIVRSNQENTNLRNDIATVTAEARINQIVEGTVTARTTQIAPTETLRPTLTPTSTPTLETPTATPTVLREFAQTLREQTSPSLLADTESVIFNPENQPSTKVFVEHFSNMMADFNVLTPNEQEVALRENPILQVFFRASNEEFNSPGVNRELADIRTGLAEALSDEASITALIDHGDAVRAALSDLPEDLRDESELAQDEFAIDHDANIPVVEKDGMLYSVSTQYGNELLATMYLQVKSAATHINSGLEPDEQMTDEEVARAVQNLTSEFLLSTYKVNEEFEGDQETRTLYSVDAEGNYVPVAILPEIVDAETRKIHLAPDAENVREQQEEASVCITLPALRQRPATFGENLDIENAQYATVITVDGVKVARLMDEEEMALESALREATEVVVIHLTDKTRGEDRMYVSEAFTVGDDGQITLVTTESGIFVLSGVCVVAFENVPSSTPAPTATPGFTPGHTEVPPTGTPDSKPSLTPNPTGTPVPSATPTAPGVTPSATNTATPEIPTATATAPATNTPAPTPTWEPTATKLPPVEPTATQAPLSTSQPTMEPSPTSNPETPVPTALPF